MLKFFFSFFPVVTDVKSITFLKKVLNLSQKLGKHSEGEKKLARVYSNRCFGRIQTIPQAVYLPERPLFLSLGDPSHELREQLYEYILRVPNSKRTTETCIFGL